MKITPINGHDRDWTKHRFIIWFGAYGETRLMVWANHLEGALDECIDWIVDNAPGLLCDDQVDEAYNEAIAKGMNPDQAYEESLVDVTTGGNCGNHVLSWEWGIVAEDPTREEILAMQGVDR